MEYITKEDFKKQVASLLVQLHETSNPKKIKEIKDKIEELRKIRISSGVEDRIKENPNIFRR